MHPIEILDLCWVESNPNSFFAHCNLPYTFKEHYCTLVSCTLTRPLGLTQFVHNPIGILSSLDVDVVVAHQHEVHSLTNFASFLEIWFFFLPFTKHENLLMLLFSCCDRLSYSYMLNTSPGIIAKGWQKWKTKGGICGKKSWKNRKILGWVKLKNQGMKNNQRWTKMKTKL